MPFIRGNRPILQPHEVIIESGVGALGRTDGDSGKVEFTNWVGGDGGHHWGGQPGADRLPHQVSGCYKPNEDAEDPENPGNSCLKEGDNIK